MSKRKAAAGVCLGMLILCLALPAAVSVARAQDAAPLEIRAAKAWEFSGDDGKTWGADPPAVPGGKLGTLLARTRFDVADPSAARFWALTHALPPRMNLSYSLNGAELAVPLAGMYYRTIPAIPAKRFRRGKNELLARIRIDNRPPRHLPDRVMEDFVLMPPRGLPTLAGQKLEFRTGPILGAFGDDFFSVAIRTSVPVPVKLTATETAWVPNRRPSRRPVKELTSPAALIHRFRVPKDGRACRVTYRLEAALGEEKVATPVRTVSLPVFGPRARPKGELRFVIMGDSRSRTDDWGRSAAAVLKERPEFVVFLGDMNDHGTNDWEWDQHYLGPQSARDLLATIPLYTVPGNHEENAPLYRQLFQAPGLDDTWRAWAKEFESVLIIGIDGQWHQEHKKTYRRIDETLAKSKAKFIFLATHYPAYSSAGNGELDSKTGEPRHWSYQMGRTVIASMLLKHNATGFFAAHEHHYERSELPGGLPQIIAGTAGAPRSGRSRDAKRRNPYAKVFARSLNYCVMEVKGDTCRMTAKAPNGRVLDTITWRARRAGEGVKKPEGGRP